MTIPDKLPIARMEDYHTHFLGTSSDDRLFWGYQTFVFAKPYSEIQQTDDWKKYRKEYVLLHTFDKDGNYLTTKHWSGLTTEVDDQQIENKLHEMISELGDVKFQDIEIKLFQIRLDNVIFGLVVDEDSEMIKLEPSSTISFQEPWDGEYYT